MKGQEISKDRQVTQVVVNNFTKFHADAQQGFEKALEFSKMVAEKWSKGEFPSEEVHENKNRLLKEIMHKYKGKSTDSGAGTSTEPAKKRIKKKPAATPPDDDETMPACIAGSASTAETPPAPDGASDAGSVTEEQSPSPSSISDTPPQFWMSEIAFHHS